METDSGMIQTYSGHEELSSLIKECASDALQKVAYVPPQKRAKYVPPHLRNAGANPQESEYVVSHSEASQKQGRPASLISFERTLSGGSSASTSFGASEPVSRSGSPCSSRESSPHSHRGVRFSHSEVHYIEKAQWEDEGTCWYSHARRRTARFRLRAHGKRICCNAGCTCDNAGLCSVGGELAKECEISIRDIFTAWRSSAGIPATVPNERLKQGLTWGMQRR